MGEGSGTISEREYGALEQELKEVRHDYRNLRHIMEISGVAHITKDDVDDVRTRLSKFETQNSFRHLKELEEDLMSLKREFDTFKTKLYTMGTVIVSFVGAILWFIEFVVKTN